VAAQENFRCACKKAKFICAQITNG